MQCSNCHFENMPGVEACGRCGGSLRLAAAQVDVHPPRAGRWAKAWRRAMPAASRFWHGICRPFLPAADMRNWTGRYPEAAQIAVLCRMILPGWPQRYLGRPRRAKVFFWSYLALLVAGLIFIGTTFGSLLLGLALSVHASSVLDVLINRPDTSIRSRVLGAAVCLTALVVILYWPAGWLISTVATPQRFLVDSPPFAAGDVLLYNRLAYRYSPPQPGDVVVCDIGTTRVQLPGRTRYPNAVLQLDGLRVERLLAGPGSRAEWADGQLTIDGRPADWLPLTLDYMPEKFAVDVPPGCYLLAPAPIRFEDIDRAAYNGLEPAFRQTALVSRNAILGRVYLRSQPLWQFGWIR